MTSHITTGVIAFYIYRSIIQHILRWDLQTRDHCSSITTQLYGLPMGWLDMKACCDVVGKLKPQSVRFLGNNTNCSYIWQTADCCQTLLYSNKNDVMVEDFNPLLSVCTSSTNSCALNVSKRGKKARTLSLHLSHIQLSEENMWRNQHQWRSLCLLTFKCWPQIIHHNLSRFKRTTCCHLLLVFWDFFVSLPVIWLQQNDLSDCLE